MTPPRDLPEKNDDPSAPLTPRFNQLSGAGRLALRGATLLTSLSGLARDDTRDHPLRYPLYAGFLGCLLLPLPAVSIVPSVILGAWIYSGLTPWARWAKNHMRQDFTHAAMIGNNMRHIVPAETPGRFRVLGRGLGGDTARRAWADTVSATRSFCRYLGGGPPV